MAEFFEFGGRGSIQNTDKLEHYRLQIKKLKEMNYILQQRYEKKIATLEQQLKNSSSKTNNSFQGYQPASKLNNEIIKRDHEINRLNEQNQRLKRQNKENPDRHLITKKRELFQVVAEKDQQIIRLKKTIHELESKYDGKYFNESKFKQEYEMLVKENQILRKEIIDNQALKKPKTELNQQILEGVRYKKQYELVCRENQHLKRELKKQGQERDAQKLHGNRVIGENTHNQLLKSEMNKKSARNQQSASRIRQLQMQNRDLREQNQSFRRSSQNISMINKQRQFNNPNKERDSVHFTDKKRRTIFDRQSESQSQNSDIKNYNYDDQMDPQYNNASKYHSTAQKSGLYDQFNLAQVRKSRKQ